MTDTECLTPCARKWRSAALLSVVVMLLLCCVGCGWASTEDKVEERILAFADAYSAGKREDLSACLAMGIRGIAAQEITVISDDLSALFSLKCKTSWGDFSDVRITGVTVSGENATATAKADVDGVTQSLTFYLTREAGEWLVFDIGGGRKKAVESTEPTQPTVLLAERYTRGIAINAADSFADGTALVTFYDNGEKRCGMIDTSGALVYSIAQTGKHPSKLTAIGGGAAVVSCYVAENERYEVMRLVGSDGTVVAEAESGTCLLACGDGLALLYRCENEDEHRFGVIDRDGQWVQPMAQLGDGSLTFEIDAQHYYAGSGVFALASDGGYLFWNSETGAQFFLDNLGDIRPQFVDGAAFVHNADRASRITAPYPGDAESTPSDYYLSADGSVRECDLDGNFVAYTDGLLVTRQNDTLLLGDAAAVYDSYPASMVWRVAFDGDYGLVILKGADKYLYFTLIDRDGNQCFDPIKREGSYRYDDCAIEYADGVVIFKNAAECYCFVDETGRVTETDYLFLEPFADNLAAASLDGTNWVYINKKNRVAISEIE